MTNMRIVRDTDVPASIAGYYYQILLAIKSLSELTERNQAVGIEKGADVRVLIKNEKKFSIEAKFYSKNMNKNSKAIRHTILNFYINSMDDEALIFSTNVGIKDDIIKEISSITKLVEIKEKHIKYMCITIMKEAVSNKTLRLDDNGNEKIINIKDKFINYLNDKKSMILKEKIDKITDYDYEEYYKDNMKAEENYFFGLVINKRKIKELIVKMQFKFGQVIDKYRSITEIKKEIHKNLKDVHCVEEKHLDYIMNMMIDEFFKTVLNNEQFKFITVGDLLEVKKKIENNEHSNILENANAEFISKLEKLDENIVEEIDLCEYDDKKSIYNRYVILRERLLGEIRLRGYSKVEEALSCYALKVESIETFEELIKFITILTIFNNIKAEKIKFILEDFRNIRIGEDNYIYKHYTGAPKAVLKSFIQKTYNNISAINEEDIVLLAGCKRAICDETISNQFVYDITRVKSNTLMNDFYRKLIYKCDRCIYFYEDSNEIEKEIDKYIKCRGWKVWEKN